MLISVSNNFYVPSGLPANMTMGNYIYQPTTADVLFGSSVAVDDTATYMVVGAYGAKTSNIAAGAIFIYKRISGTWTQQARFSASDLAANDWFGFVVDISADGSTIAVGAPLDDTTGGTNSGSVAIYTRSGEAWSLQQRILGTAASQQFGRSLSLSASGDMLLIGTTRSSASACAQVYTRTNAVWTKQANLLPANSTSGLFGQYVNLSSDGSIAIVASPSDTVSGFSSAGSVIIFTRSGTSWTEVQTISSASPSANANFGASGVTISGDKQYIAVCDMYATANSVANAGKVHIYSNIVGSWTLQASITPSDTSELQFGSSIAFNYDGSMIVVGRSANYGTLRGASYVFKRVGTSWNQSTKLLPHLLTTNMGESVSMSQSSDYLVIGSMYAVYYMPM